MSDAPAHGTTDHERLDFLLREVNRARVRVRENRGTGAQRSWDNQRVQRELLVALEEYVAALSARGRPVPYRLRDELHLYRTLDLG